MMLKKNEDIKLTIDGMTAEGSGVGHFDGQAVFVRNTAIGDEIECHIIKAKQNYVVGKINNILKASPDRIIPDCEAAGKCGGCAFRHITYEKELEIKEQRVRDAFERLAHLNPKIEPIIGADETDHYRNKAQFPIAKDTRTNEPLIGFYTFNTHRIVPQKDCKLQPEIFKDILDITENWIKENNISVYDEEKNKGLLRHIYIREGRHTKEVLAALVINGDEIPNENKLITELQNGIPKLKSIVLNINKENSNVILGPYNKVIFGDGYITDKLLGKTFRISPLSFYQINSDQCEKLYCKVKNLVSNDNDLLLDLYCGIGTIGITLADTTKKLVGVEIIPEAVEDAKKNAQLNKITNAEFFCGDAKAIAQNLKEQNARPDTIVVDPPRKGLDAELPEIISGMAPRRLVYVSCDPATLARDCARLAALGFTIQTVQPLDMFPRTSHVECVTLMTKK
ncbi:MAG: 23S rRNA (uracil(1939)-C(5))-methyltransferase RlmD [Clostridia bacterium]|nr:23S rRNA (uracil(1939)-C(5))-methyltransferase RlmD [Clostridia bacterium]